MIVYINTKSKKKKSKTVTKKQKALKDSWDRMMAKFDTKPSQMYNPKNEPSKFMRETKSYPSLDTMSGNCNKSPEKVYTGESMIGISVLHKSNLVPVFSKEDAEAHAKMRRG